MYELSLFTGIGGGLLGTHLLGWTPIGYIEFNDYCQRVIAQRIKDGYLPNAPIFGDIRAFIAEGFARSYTGMVDVVTAGFPCQPFARGSKRLHDADSRNRWPETLRVIEIVKPKWVYLENSPELLTYSQKHGRSAYIEKIAAELAKVGYVGRWGCLSASSVGADHKRERLWIIAHAGSRRWPIVLRRDVLMRVQSNSGRKKTSSNSLDAIFATIARLEERLGEPSILRTDDGMPNRVDRLKAIGNAQVPAVVKAVWGLLNDE